MDLTGCVNKFTLGGMSRDPALRALILGSYLVVTAVSLVGCGDVDNSASSPSSPAVSSSPSTGETAYPDEEFLGDYEGIPEDTSGPRNSQRTAPAGRDGAGDGRPLGVLRERQGARGVV